MKPPGIPSRGGFLLPARRAQDREGHMPWKRRADSYLGAVAVYGIIALQLAVIGGVGFVVLHFLVKLW